MEMIKINPIIEKAKKDKDVIAVALFGSSLKGHGRDIDICLFLKGKKSNSEMTKKRLEYLKGSYNKLDINIFQQLPVYIRIRILKEHKILFCKNEDLLYEIAFLTIKEFNFYEKLYRLCLRSVENG